MSSAIEELLSRRRESRGISIEMKRLAVVALLLLSCKRGAEPKAEVSEETRPGTERGSAGGFSASLSADLEVRGPSKGSGDFFADVAGSDSGSAAAGSNAGDTAADPKANAKPTEADAPANGGSSADPGAAKSADPGMANAADGSAANASSASSADASAKADPTKPDAKAADAKAADVKAADAKAIEIDPPKAAIAMTPELKAIKLSLLPNWKRDVVEPATISLDVDVQSRDVKETFKFHYGYEDSSAPTDREAFKKYLASAKILNVTTDRQRGAAWYLEGTDARGGTAFRLIVTWGGKRLYCGGSSYKNNSLGDIRDEVVIQAKKICETLAL